jgi:salicylate hydroxylase
MAARGLDVTVVERAGQLGAGGSELVLHPNGVRAADALGAQIGARIRATGHVTRPDDVRVTMDARGTVLVEESIGVADPQGTPQIAVLRSALHRALLDEALTAGAVVCLGTTAIDYTVHAGHVTVQLAEGANLTCEALIGADGIHSVVRARMLSDGPPQYLGYASVRGHSHGSVLGQRGYVVNGCGIQLFVAPVGEDTLCWTANIDAPAGEWPAKGPVAARLALLHAMEGWYQPVVDLIRGARPRNVAVIDVHDRASASRWVEGRVALLGDAAHPVVPALGQGADMALEDAAVLAESLASPDEVPDALAAYARKRMARAADTVLLSRRSGAPDQGSGRASEERHTTSATHRDAEVADVLAWRSGPRDLKQATAPAPPATVRTKKGDNAMPAPRIVVISGSLRPGSTCDQVAQWCAQRCAEQGASARVLTGSEIDFPAYRPGLAHTHAAVAGFLDELRGADGVILVSPTYHATVSGLLKNALDYVNDIGGPVPYLEGRAIGTVAVGSGAQGAVSTLTTLRTIGHALRGWPTPVGAAVARIPQQPPTDGAELEPDAARLVEMVSQVVWLGEVRAAGRTVRLGTVA